MAWRDLSEFLLRSAGCPARSALGQYCGERRKHVHLNALMEMSGAAGDAVVMRSSFLTRFLKMKLAHIERAAAAQLPTGMRSVCLPGVPFTENVKGTVSLAATLGTTTLN